MTFFLQLVVTGFSLGMVYALVAIGFVIILKCSEAFNIAQGHIVLIGGYLGYTFLVPLGLPVWASLLLAIGVAIIMGLLIERLTLRPLVGQPVLAVIIVGVVTEEPAGRRIATNEIIAGTAEIGIEPETDKHVGQVLGAFIDDLILRVNRKTVRSG